MMGKLRKEYEKEAGTKLKLVTFLWKEKEYADALLEHLLLKYNWAFTATDELDSSVEEADLILAEEGWFDDIREREDLWNKTVFFLEREPHEDPLTREEFPILVWKYDGFSRIRRRISAALEQRCGRDLSVKEEYPAILIAGSWEYRDNEECWEIARELAYEIKQNVLYMNLERLSGKKMRQALELSYTVEDILYYALDRLEMDGIDPSDSVRGAMEFEEGVCSFPGWNGTNPLQQLSRREWETLIPILGKASEAEVAFVWTGRENMEYCKAFCGHIAKCVYVKPKELDETEENRWDQMKYWLEHEGKSQLQTEIHLVDSWSEIYEIVKGFGHELA